MCCFFSSFFSSFSLRIRFHFSIIIFIVIFFFFFVKE